MLDTQELLKVISGHKKGPIASLTRFALGLATPVYRVAVGFRNHRFDSGQTTRRVSIPVISVGNLTTGGTGKTPMVVWIARLLRQLDLRVALVSRGYAHENTGTSRNDEALELEHRLKDVPHLQSPDRFEMAQVAVDELESQVIILDDGFQHRQLARNLDIVLIDALQPFGFGRLLPRGLLREPISSLNRADAVVLTRCDAINENAKQKIKSIVLDANPNVKWAETKTVPKGLLQFDGVETDVEELKKKKLFAFCGIGNPAGFGHSLKSCDLTVIAQKNFADHHGYTREELSEIGKLASNQNADAIVCTHKDLVKVGVNRLGGVPVYALVIDIEFEYGQDELHTLIENAIDSEKS